MFAPSTSDVRDFFGRRATQARRGRRADAARDHRRRLDRRPSRVRRRPRQRRGGARRPLRRRQRPRESVPALVDAPVDQRAGRHRPTARHPRGLRATGGPARVGARCAARGHGVPRPHAVGRAAQRGGRRTATRTSTACAGARRVDRRAAGVDERTEASGRRWRRASPPRRSPTAPSRLFLPVPERAPAGPRARLPRRSPSPVDATAGSLRRP